MRVNENWAESDLADMNEVLSQLFDGDQYPTHPQSQLPSLSRPRRSNNPNGRLYPSGGWGQSTYYTNQIAELSSSSTIGSDGHQYMSQHPETQVSSYNDHYPLSASTSYYSDSASASRHRYSAQSPLGYPPFSNSVSAANNAFPSYHPVASFRLPEVTPSYPTVSAIPERKPTMDSLPNQSNTTTRTPSNSSAFGHPMSESSLTNDRQSYITSVTGNPISYHDHGEAPSQVSRDAWSGTIGQVSPPSSSISPDSTASHSDDATLAMQDQSNQHGLSDERTSMMFSHMQVLKDVTCNGQLVVPHITAKIVKNIFIADGSWTCYRRNYIPVECSYTMTPCMPNGRLFLKSENSVQHQIQALAVSLCAQVGDNVGKVVELVKHTAKRDKGPQFPVGFEKLSPSSPGSSQPPYHGTTAINGPYLPLQFDDGQQISNEQGPPLSLYTFERVQFKKATANNGKRRAQQQFHHLVVMLLADIRVPGGDTPFWVKIAQSTSDALIVRGRSPSHYAESKNHSNAGPRGPGGASGGSRGHRLPNGSNRHVARAPRQSYSGSRPTRGAGSNRSRYHTVNNSSLEKLSVSLAALAEDQQDSMMTDYESDLIDGIPYYQYYPSPLSDASDMIKLEFKHLPHCSSDGSDSSHQFDSKHLVSACHGGPFPNYHGVDTSRGLYPGTNTIY